MIYNKPKKTFAAVFLSGTLLLQNASVLAAPPGTMDWLNRTPFSPVDTPVVSSAKIPPSYSAVNVNGKRAYDLARKGREVELKPKILVIYEIELLSFSPVEIRIRVVCSKGTYIRALARDIGSALGSGGHLTALRRTRVGDVTIGDCLTIDQTAELIRTVSIEMPEEVKA